MLGAWVMLACSLGPAAVAAEEIVTPQNYYQEPKNVVPPPITQAQAIAHVRQNYRGRVLSFRPYQHGYRFRIDMKGRVKTVDVDGNTLRDK